MIFILLFLDFPDENHIPRNRITCLLKKKIKKKEREREEKRVACRLINGLNESQYPMCDKWYYFDDLKW